MLLLLCGVVHAKTGSRAARSVFTPSVTALPQNGEGTADSQQSTQPIPLAQIADRADEADQLLEQINGQLLTSADLSEAEGQAASQEREIVERSRQTRQLLASAVTPLEIEDEQRYWRSRSQQYSAQRKELTTRAANLDEQIRLLDTQLSQWQLTWDQVHDAPGIETIADRVSQQLKKMRATRSEAQDQLNIILTLQNRISQEDQQATEILFRTREAREQDRSRILQPDSRPLWRITEAQQAGQTSPASRRFFARSLTNAAEFLRTHKLATMGLVCAYLLALLGVFGLKKYLLGSIPSAATIALLELLKAPYSMALLLGLFATRGYVASAPVSIAFVFYLLCVLPVLRLLVPVTEPRLRVLIYLAAIFYMLEGMHLLIQLPLSVSRIVHALLTGGAAAALVRLAGRPGLAEVLQRSRRMKCLKVSLYLTLALLIVSLFANLVGFFSLAQLVALVALVAPFVAASFYCGARIVLLASTILIDNPTLRASLQTGTAAARWWSERIVAAAAFLLWLKTMLQLLTVYDVAVGAVSRFLQRPIGFQRAHFTIGGVLGVIVIMLGGYALANVAALLLNTLLLHRLPLQRGLPYAISRITYYLLLLTVAVFALSAAGVELNKFTVLTGAMGVGLGFGLQNIVSNFVSGIILLCERPIHVGDVVEVNGLVGTVRRIGARSSTVVTFQGAEVIVPNGNLLSDHVINWTLSSQWRRVDIKVGVAYGTDPEKVIKLLVKVAESHPDVLTERPPAAFFVGFGESALNFELRFWCARQDLWFQLQSDVTIAIAYALREAGIAIPFPQRELHVHGIEVKTEEAVADRPAPWPELPGARTKSARL